MDARGEMLELERLFALAPHSDEFLERQRQSKWGERIHEEVLLGIETGLSEAIEYGVLFLEQNPRYFRSGYFKAAIASKLKAAPLTADQRTRLQAVILNAVSSAKVGPEFSEYARLATVVASPEFVEQSVALRARVSGWSQARCDRLLSHCQNVYR